MKRSYLTETKLICPECSAIVITPQPESIIWERCPSCGIHMWDKYDLMMGEKVSATKHANRSGAATSAHNGRG